jgi:hypothetical protein
MPTPGLYTTPDAMPKATLRARGRDKKWMIDGRCRGHTGDMKYAWRIDPDRKVAVIAGVTVRVAELISAALKVCVGCPVQYDCVSWAVFVDEKGGTWGLSTDDMDWLKRRTDWETIIAKAQARHVPIQVAVRRARAV